MYTSDPVKENEREFQEAWDLYWHQETTEKGWKKQWDRMFISINKACLNIAKSKCYNLHVRDLEDKAMDATLKIMEKIQNGTRPQRLSSFCYLYTIGQLWSKKERRWDTMVDLDWVANNKIYSADDDNNIWIETIENEGEINYEFEN